MKIYEKLRFDYDNVKLPKPEVDSDQKFKSKPVKLNVCIYSWCGNNHKSVNFVSNDKVPFASYVAISHLSNISKETKLRYDRSLVNTITS